MVVPGDYSAQTFSYSVLRTLQDGFGLGAVSRLTRPRERASRQLEVTPSKGLAAVSPALARPGVPRPRPWCSRTREQPGYLWPWREEVSLRRLAFDRLDRHIEATEPAATVLRVDEVEVRSLNTGAAVAAGGALG